MSDRFDRALVRGKVSIILWLGAAALGLAVMASAAVALLHLHYRHESLSYSDGLWQELIRTIDPGQIAEDRGPFRLIGLVVTLGGVLIVSTLISLVNNRIQLRVEHIRKGRDPVNVEDHIVILGWSDIATKVVEELAAARIDGRPPDVVVLGTASVDAMRSELDRARLKDVKRNWPTLRSGSSSDPRDLVDLASVATARAVVVLEQAHDTAVEDSIKTILAVVAACDGLKLDSASAASTPDVILAVASESDPGDLLGHLKRRLVRVGYRLTILDTIGLQTELAAQVSQRAGLSAVYSDLLNFRGDEFYEVEPPVGILTFGSAVVSLAAACPIGMVRGRHPAREIQLWPEWDEPLGGSKLIVLASDHASGAEAASSSRAEALTGPRRDFCPRPLRTERIMLLGWNSGARHLLEVLDKYAGPGSVVHAVADPPPGDIPALENIDEVTAIHPPEGVQQWVETNREYYDHAIVLARDGLTPAAADAETLVTLVGLRPAGREHRNPSTVVAQLLERQNKHLATGSLADDLIVGDALTALALAQLAMNPSMWDVFHEILGDTSYSIELLSIDDALDGQPATTFLDVVRIVASHGEIALGWRKGTAIELNPPKASPLDQAHETEIVVFTRLHCDRSVDGTTGSKRRPSGAV